MASSSSTPSSSSSSVGLKDDHQDEKESSGGEFSPSSTVTWVEKYSKDVPPRVMLAEQMKAIEARVIGAKLDADKHWLIRLDGHGFSKFTQGFSKPCDVRIHQAMVYTSVDLLVQFGAVSVYTESDEITLIFPAKSYFLEQGLKADPPLSADQIHELQHSVDTFTLPYNGKVQKIVSLLAGYCSARFNHHIATLAGDDTNPTLRVKASGGFAYFDARVFQLDHTNQVLHNIIWRSQDAVRNSKSMLGHAFLKKNAMHGLTSDEIIHKVFKERGIDYYSFPKWFHGGVLIKKTTALREAINKHPKLTEPVKTTCIRRLLVQANWIDLPSATSELLLSKNVSDIPLFEELFTEIEYKSPKHP